MYCSNSQRIFPLLFLLPASPLLLPLPHRFFSVSPRNRAPECPFELPVLLRNPGLHSFSLAVFIPSYASFLSRRHRRRRRRPPGTKTSGREEKAQRRIIYENDIIIIRTNFDGPRFRHGAACRGARSFPPQFPVPQSSSVPCPASKHRQVFLPAATARPPVRQPASQPTIARSFPSIYDETTERTVQRKISFSSPPTVSTATNESHESCSNSDLNSMKRSTQRPRAVI